MKNYLVFVLTFALGLYSGYLGSHFVSNHNLKAAVSGPKRFVVSVNQDTEDGVFQIITDTETGKKYFYYCYGQSGAITEIK